MPVTTPGPIVDENGWRRRLAINRGAIAVERQGDHDQIDIAWCAFRREPRVLKTNLVVDERSRRVDVIAVRLNDRDLRIRCKIAENHRRPRKESSANHRYPAKRRQFLEQRSKCLAVHPQYESLQARAIKDHPFQCLEA